MTITKFPILSRWQWERYVTMETLAKLPFDVPWSMVADHEPQAKINHDRSLAKLASRGGLSPAGLWCVVHDRRFYDMKTHEPAITEQDAAAWLAAALTQVVNDHIADAGKKVGGK